MLRSLETKKRVAGQFAVKYKKEASCWTQKPKQGRLRGRQVLGTSCFRKTINTVAYPCTTRKVSTVADGHVRSPFLPAHFLL